jgi:hypothetical protein
MLNPQLIRNHRDELAVGRLRLADVDRVAEDKADAVDVATSPGWILKPIFPHLTEYL